ncbi:MAG TPA: recombination regulator RecX [Burkholderiaceae bacterium]|nr:recombination regulator RecX [Burkholderiaceae bacterium]
MTASESSRARAGGQLSLKARAIALLSRREHSRAELRRKLAPHAEQPEVLDALLDELERGNWLSHERFAESLVHRRAARHGWRRVAQELRQHDLPPETLSAAIGELQCTEFERARAVWQKRFSQAPADAREYARQLRYMAARGFTGDTVRRILADVGGTMPDDLPSPDELE